MSMCCLSCSCAFKLQLLPVPALGFVRALRYEQHLLFLLLVFLLEGLLVQIHVEVPALAGLGAVSAILCAACLVPVH